MPPDYPQKEDDSSKDKEEKLSRLENFEERLYSKNFQEETENKRGSFGFGARKISAVRSEWEARGMPKEKIPESVSSRTTYGLLKQILIGAIILFVVALGVAAYVFLGGRNIVSTKNILININTPPSIAGGEPLPVEISVTNQNNVALVSADLIVEYSDGGRQPDDLSKELKRYRETLGTFKVGEAINKKFEVVFFGEEGESKDVKVTLEYRADGSNAIFSKSEARTIRLASAPVSVAIAAVQDVSPGEVATFSVTIVANASQTVEHLLLSADYPFGFVPSGADPKPTSGNNVWDMGDLKPGATRVLKIRGQFSGNEGEERAIRFSVGSPDKYDNRRIGVVFLSKTYTVRLTKPFIGVDLVLGGGSGNEYVTGAGSQVRADVVFKNNLDTKITNVIIEAKLKGAIYDRGSVSANMGFFRSIDNTVVWDQTTSKNLAELEPGDGGVLSFSFKTFRSAVSAKSPSMSVEVSVKGSKISAGGLAEQVVVTTSKTVKIASELGLDSMLIYSNGPFQNSGPVPPKIETETTYTVKLSVTNSSNDLSNVEVLTSIPVYVRWMDKISPENEMIKYNPVGGGIVWDAGDLKAGETKEVNFQVAFLPSLSQVGGYPIILNGASASGFDGFSGSTINSPSSGNLDINMPNDSSYSGKGGPVIK